MWCSIFHKHKCRQNSHDRALLIFLVLIILVIGCSAHIHHHTLEHMTTQSEWSRAFTSTAIISIFPTLILPFIPLSSTNKDGTIVMNESLQKMLLSFAAGGLLGEVFLHSIPHLMGSHDHHKEHHHSGHSSSILNISLWILTGFLFFFTSEKIVKIVLGEECHHHHHHGSTVNMLKDKIESESDDESQKNDSSSLLRKRRSSARTSQIQESKSREEEKVASSSNGHHNSDLHHTSGSSSKPVGLKASGYLNIVVDLLHNFTDGIAIGASFASGHGVGLATTLSVFLHEVPHEIGDFAILVQSGMSFHQAIMMQFYTALAAFVGTLVGLLSKRHQGLESILVAITAGGFLYVAAVSVLPELLQGKSTAFQSLKEAAGVLAGIGLMAWVALGEEENH